MAKTPRSRRPRKKRVPLPGPLPTNRKTEAWWRFYTDRAARLARIEQIHQALRPEVPRRMRWLLDEVVQLAREREDLWDRWRKLHQDRERAQIALKATGRHGRVNEILGLAERGRPRKIPADLGRKICALPLDADLEQEMQNIATEAGVEFDTVHRKVRGELAALAESGDRAAREALARLPARPWSEDGKKKKS